MDNKLFHKILKEQIDSCTNKEGVVDYQTLMLLINDHYIIQDIAIKNSEDSNSKKNEFLSRMSHEIRTQLNAIIGMTGLLLESELNDQQKNYADIISGSGESLLSIINDILDLFEIEFGKLYLEKSPFELTSSMDDIVDLLAMKSQEKSVEFLIHYPKSEYMLIGDEEKIKQVLINLIGNAIKFTEQGHVKLSLVTSDVPGNKLRVTFMVQDTGIGIDPSRLGNIFEKLDQSEIFVTRNFGGAGIGLAISKKLVEFMGGNLWVESVVGQGSCFYFNITLDKGNKLLEANENPEISVEEKKKVILIAPYKETREVYGEYLREANYTVDEASSPDESLTLIVDNEKDKPYDIIIFDYGNEIQLVADFVEKSATKVSFDNKLLLAMSSLALGQQGEAKDNLQKLGFSALVSKPAHPWQLTNIIAVCFDSKIVKKKPIFLTKHDVSKKIKIHESEKNSLTKTQYYPDFSHIHVLVVEDVAINQFILMNILRKMKCRVDAVANGVEAVEIVKNFNYDLIFMDCNMPEKDGYEATKDIRKFEINNITRSIIVALTADAMEGDREKCLNAGMDDYLYKPINQDFLIKIMLKYLSNKNNN